MTDPLPAILPAAQQLDRDAMPSGVAPTPEGGYRLGIEFTGSGSEYFRIWIVNLVLIIVTLGIYFPWAKVRRLRYFSGNTLVAGEPLDFHGSPIKMLKGYVLVGVLFAVYSAAGNFSPVAGFVAFLVIVALAPALFKSAMQFRLANTSWRGLRFSFKGDLVGAYRAAVPFFLPGLAVVGLSMGVVDQRRPPDWFGVGLALVMALFFLTLPWLLWNFKRYQHNHYALGSLQTSLRTSVGSFYMLFLKAIVPVIVAGIAVGLLFGVFFGAMPKQPGAGGLSMVLMFMLLLLALIVPMATIKPIFVALMQNLVWSRTGNDRIRFYSELSIWSLLLLNLKNWLLIVVTLGLYWPFAAIATARMRLEAVRIATRDDPQTMFAQMSTDGEAAGDAAGDLFGFDIGL